MRWFLLALPVLLASCVSVMKPKIGMSENAWLRTTLVADLAHMEGNVKVYKSGGAFYYFRNGRLEKVDSGEAPSQRVELKQVSQ